MAKDYKKWHRVKSRIENEFILKKFNTREIWWCALGENIGVEIDGKNQLYQRPVLILLKFNKYMFWAVPLSTQTKEGKIFSPFIHKGKNETALLAQMRLISSKRLVNRMGRVNPQTFKEIIRSVSNLLNETEPQ